MRQGIILIISLMIMMVIFLNVVKKKVKSFTSSICSASAIGRYHSLNINEVGEMMSLDVAFQEMKNIGLNNYPRRSMIKLKRNLLLIILSCTTPKLYFKKGINAENLKNQLLESYIKRGAEFPAEHNVGHEYKANDTLINFTKN